VLAGYVAHDGTSHHRIRHLARGTQIDVLRQRSDDSRVEVMLIGDSDSRVFLVPADAIDEANARAMSIHRPPRHRRSSGSSLVPVDWKPAND
jgi:hypothetical protein